jgi:hypothetical protein
MLSLQMVDLNRVMVQQAEILVGIQTHLTVGGGAASAQPAPAPVAPLPQRGPRA